MEPQMIVIGHNGIHNEFGIVYNEPGTLVEATEISPGVVRINKVIE